MTTDDTPTPAAGRPPLAPTYRALHAQHVCVPGPCPGCRDASRCAAGPCPLCVLDRRAAADDRAHASTADGAALAVIDALRAAREACDAAEAALERASRSVRAAEAREATARVAEEDARVAYVASVFDVPESMLHPRPPAEPEPTEH